MKQFVLILTVLVLVALVWSQLDTPVAQNKQTRIVSVEGFGEIEVEPDIIHLNYTISALNENDVAAAKADVDKRSSNSIYALMKLGVKESDITSSSLRVDMAEDYQNRIRQHRVTRSVEITLRNIEVYNAALQALVDSGVSEINQVQPDVSNEAELKRQALANATQDAEDQARFLARQFGASLDKVHQIGRQNIQRHFDMQEMAVMSSRGAPKNMNEPYEFKPGKVKVSSNIYVEFELK